MIEFGAAGSKSLEPITRARDEGPSSTTAAALESQLQQERAERRIERFCWIFVYVASINVVASWLAPAATSVLCLIFSLLAIILFAKWLEVPFILPQIERWYDRITATSKPTETE